MEDAWKLFNKMPSCNMLLDCHNIGTCEMWARAEVVETIFSKCNRKVCKQILSLVSFGCLMSASVVALEEGRHAHVQVTWNGYDSHIFVSNSMIDIYAKWGSIEDAWRVFNKIPSCGVVSFDVMILAHVVEMWARAKCTRTISKKCNWKLCSQTLSFLWGTPNECASVRGSWKSTEYWS
jgi:pentatricopeptide repeat protein